MRLGGRSSRNVCLGGSLGSLGVLLDATDGSGGSSSALSASSAAGGRAAAGDALVGLEDLVKRLVELVRHVGWRIGGVAGKGSDVGGQPVAKRLGDVEALDRGAVKSRAGEVASAAATSLQLGSWWKARGRAEPGSQARLSHGERTRASREVAEERSRRWRRSREKLQLQGRTMSRMKRRGFGSRGDGCRGERRSRREQAPKESSPPSRRAGSARATGLGSDLISLRRTTRLRPRRRARRMD